MNKTKPKLFFILGCQRTGTTLMRLILESHSMVKCFDEPQCYEILKNHTELLKSNQKEKFLCFKTPILTEQMDEPFFSDVTIDFIINNHYQNFPQIFMVRDVRDTISSMMTLKQEKSTWYDLWPKKSLEFWIATIPGFEKIFAKDIRKISNSKNKLISYSSFYWKYKTGAFFNYEKKRIVHLIKYEDLVSDPLETIQGLVKFLKLNFEDALMVHHKKKHSLTNERGITIGNTDTKLPIFNESIGRYKKTFSKSQLQEINNISGDVMEKLRYSF